jgi:nitronate monooxygenase
MKFQTSLCHLFNVDLPIVQAPIGSASCPALAAAVSNAGALGMLSVTWRSLDATRTVIRETRALTDKPFGVNLVLQWEQTERLKVCLEEGVRIVSFFWGDPTPYVKTAHDAGALVMHTVASAEEAKRVVDAGVDIVVAQGWEAGGHVWGTVATLPLVPRVVDAVSPTPVIAAGGIADGRGIAAVLMLGAAGAWLGTRFLLSEEAAAHRIYKGKIAEAKETDTVYSRLFDVGWENAPHRTLRNSTVQRWEEEGCPPSGQRPNEGEVIVSLGDGRSVPRYSDVIPLPNMTGDLEALALYAGQSAGLASKMQPAGEIVRELAEETARALQRGVENVQKSRCCLFRI